MSLQHPKNLFELGVVTGAWTVVDELATIVADENFVISGETMWETLQRLRIEYKKILDSHPKESLTD